MILNLNLSWLHKILKLSVIHRAAPCNKNLTQQRCHKWYNACTNLSLLSSTVNSLACIKLLTCLFAVFIFIFLSVNRSHSFFRSLNSMYCVFLVYSCNISSFFLLSKIRCSGGLVFGARALCNIKFILGLYMYEQ